MRKSMLFALIFLILGIVLFIQAQQIEALWEEPMGPEAYPKIIAVLIIAASAMNIFTEFRSVRRKQAPIAEENKEASETGKKKAEFLPVTCIAILGALYVLGLNYVGFYTSTLLFCIMTMGTISYFTNPESIKKELITRNLPISIGIIVVLYVAANVMHIYLPQGGFLW